MERGIERALYTTKIVIWWARAKNSYYLKPNLVKNFYFIKYFSQLDNFLSLLSNKKTFLQFTKKGCRDFFLILQFLISLKMHLINPSSSSLATQWTHSGKVMHLVAPKWHRSPPPTCRRCPTRWTGSVVAMTTLVPAAAPEFVQTWVPCWVCPSCTKACPRSIKLMLHKHCRQDNLRRLQNPPLPTTLATPTAPSAFHCASCREVSSGRNVLLYVQVEPLPHLLWAGGPVPARLHPGQWPARHCQKWPQQHCRRHRSNYGQTAGSRENPERIKFQV